MRIKHAENRKNNNRSFSIFARCYTKVIRNIPDVKYTSLFLLYFPAYNGDTTESNNSIKKLIVPATFNTSWARDRIKIVSKSQGDSHHKSDTSRC